MQKAPRQRGLKHASIATSAKTSWRTRFRLRNERGELLNGALKSWPRQQGFIPAMEMRLLAELDPHKGAAPHPAEMGKVGDAERIACDISLLA